MAVPTILATEATALDSSKKRKLQDGIDLSSGDGTATHTAIIVEPELAHHHGHVCDGNHDHDHHHHHGDDDDGEDYEDDESEGDIMEQIMDQLEVDPYVPDESFGVTKEAISRVHARLREVGIEQFFQENLSNDPASARRLGPIFGLDPELEIDDGFYLRVLSAAIVRAYHKRQKLYQYNTIDDAARLLTTCSKIMVITGAGISTSLGIPDFRSKGTGFYDKVRQMGFDEPEDVFDIDYFEERPEVFYSLAGDILPDQQRFSPTHAFIRLLQDKGRLQTNYTQNIDNLEAAAGIDEDRIIQCHGSFATATCRKCGHRVKGVEIYPDIRAKRIPKCEKCIARMASEDSAADTRPPKRSKPSNKWEGDDDDDQNDDIPQPGIMKPDITFFGEQLPNTFFDRLTNTDAEHTDLVIVIGTSLKVAPVSEMPNYIPHTVPHIYISLEPIRHVEFDIQLLGSCDVVVQELCRRAGWDLTHEMIPENAPSPKVLQVPGRPHIWAIEAEGGDSVGAAAAVAATEQRNGAGDAPSNTAAAELVAQTSTVQDATPGTEEKILLASRPVTSEK